MINEAPIGHADKGSMIPMGEHRGLQGVLERWFARHNPLRKTVMEDLLSQRFLKVGEVAQLLQLSVRTIWRMRSAGELPAPMVFRGAVRWPAKELMAWLADHRHASTAAPHTNRG